MNSLGDSAKAHGLLVAVQALKIVGMFFPLRALLLTKTELTNGQAGAIAAVTIIAPIFLISAAMVTPYALFTSALVYFFYFFDDALQNPTSKTSAVCAGLLLGAQLLLLPLGLVVWLAAILTITSTIIISNSSRRKPGSQTDREPASQGALDSGFRRNDVFLLISIALLPLIFIAISGGQGLVPELYTNSPLARFNYVKNGALTMLYDGLPFAGLALLLVAFLKPKEFWPYPTARFVFFTVLGALFYAAFTTQVVVDAKLDYFTNRLLEPFLFLPVIVLFRISAQTRREIFYNGLLVFFVLAIFNLPYGLNLDFKSGLTFWSQSLANPHLGFMKNIAYMALLLVPATFLTWRPKAVIPAYIVISLIMGLAGAYANQRWWQANEDAPFSRIEARAFNKNDQISKAPFIATDFACSLQDNKDVAYLFRCLDSMKALYFLNKPIKKISDNIAEKHQYFFLPTQGDVQNSEAVATAGLAKVTVINKANEAEVVKILKMDGAQPYIHISFPEGQQRVTALAPRSKMELNIEEAGCYVLKARLAFDAKGGGTFTAQLNDNPAQKRNVPEIGFEKLPAETELRLQLSKGTSNIAINYGDAPNSVLPPDNKLILIGRPYFAKCK